MGSIPGTGRSPGEGNGNHPNFIAWKIPWTEEPGGLYPWGHKELDMTEHAHIEFLKVNPFNYISSKTTSSPPQGQDRLCLQPRTLDIHLEGKYRAAFVLKTSEISLAPVCFSLVPRYGRGINEFNNHNQKISLISVQKRDENPLSHTCSAL